MSQRVNRGRARRAGHPDPAGQAAADYRFVAGERANVPAVAKLSADSSASARPAAAGRCDMISLITDVSGKERTPLGYA